MNLAEAREQLQTRTAAGQINWRPTEQRNAVSVRLEGASVVLINHDMPEKELLSITDIMGSAMTAPKRTGISLELRNADGKTVGRLNLKPESADFDAMKDLWRLAYDRAYKIQETYDSLARALAAEGEIG